MRDGVSWGGAPMRERMVWVSRKVRTAPGTDGSPRYAGTHAQHG